MIAAHGTRARYVGGPCRCSECREANCVYRAEHDRLKLYGRYDDLVDAEPVRQHVAMLSRSGIGRRRLVALSGVADSAVQALKTGKRGKPVLRVRKTTAEAILAVRPEVHTVADHALVDARGTHRRLQALIARGWTQRWLNDRLGLSSDNMGTWFEQTTVLQRKAAAVGALYEELWDQAPPVRSSAQAGAARRAMNHARAHGWFPPLAWDDIDTDAEPPTPDEIGGEDELAIELALAGEPVKLTPAERRIAVTRLHTERWSDGRIADTLHINERTVLRIRQELGLQAFDQNDLRNRGAA